MQAKQEHFDIPLHDIKPLIEIQEYSLYYSVALGIVSTIILFSVLYLLIKYLKNRNKFNIRAEHLSLLNAITYEDAKKDAYDITLYGATFKDDSQRHSNAYRALVDSLEEYKYRKNVDAFSDETKHHIDIYLGMIDV
ncbi:MAG: hypothetical protein U9N39_03650 [Campylobacterota bacterium]|nr:hypothetical protein [Campylobacterota bacterium]